VQLWYSKSLLPKELLLAMGSRQCCGIKLEQQTMAQKELTLKNEDVTFPKKIFFLNSST
jgi:hypothetical protein